MATIAFNDHLADKHASIEFGVLANITFKTCINILLSLGYTEHLAQLCLSLCVNAFALIYDQYGQLFLVNVECGQYVNWLPAAILQGDLN